MKAGWTLRALNELAYVSRGRSRHRPRNDPALYGGEYPFVQTADIHEADLYITNYSQTYNEKGLQQSRLWEPGTICITIAGENTGDCAILGISACFPDSAVGVVSDPMKADTTFLKYAIDRLRPQVRKVTRGATQDNLSIAKLLAFKFPTPPVAIQRRIGEILRNYGDLIACNRRRIALLEAMARHLYDEWFVRLRFPGHEHTRTTNGVPQGWARRTLGDLADITMGQSPESKHYNEDGEGLPFHQGVSDFGDRFVTHRIYSTALNRTAQPGDVLCSVRAPVGRLNVTLDKIVIGRGLAALRSKSGHQPLLFQQLKAHFFREDLIGGGAIFASVTKKEFSTQELLEPPERIKRAFDEITAPCEEQLRVLFLQSQRLRAARGLLVPRLMSGEIEV